MNKVIEGLEITEYAAEGKSMGKKEGKVYFTPYTAPGDVVKIRLGQRRKSFSIGRVMEYQQYSKNRVPSFCDHFGLCGGCQWQHVSIEEQLKFKSQQVKDNFERLGGIPTDNLQTIISSPKEKEYRNKLEFTFSDSRWLDSEEISSGMPLNRNGLGFHLPGRFDRVIEIKKCHLQEDLSNQIRNWVGEFALKSELPFYNFRKHKGFWRTLMLRNNAKGEWMVFFQFGKENKELIEELGTQLIKNFPTIKSISYAINTKKNDTFYDLEIKSIFGPIVIEELIGPIKINIGPKSFLQTNLGQALNIYDKVLELGDFKGTELVWDLYSGVGSIALYIAAKVKKVIGIENVEMAVDDANNNAKLNKIKNASFVLGDVKTLLIERPGELNERPDLVIVDPPREGLHQDCVQSLINLEPARIIYISCKPSTQARDLQELIQKYSVEVIQPFDMFPHTHHIENVVLLKRK